MIYRIRLDAVAQAWIDVDLVLSASPGSTTELRLPVWTPGSYLVRDYSRHVVDLSAESDTGQALEVVKVRKNRWLVAHRQSAEVRIRYRVYARELTVRTSFVTHDWAFWNGACVLIWPVDRELETARVEVALPSGWRLVTGRGDARPDGAGQAVFELRGLDEAIDTPCLAGADREWRFEHAGCAHRLVAAGLAGFRVPDSFVEDLRKVVAAVHAVFGGDLPFAEYVFLALFGVSWDHAG